MVKAAPAASFVMPPSDFLLELLVVAFDDPALLGRRQQILALGFLGQVRQPGLRRLRFFRRPLDQQPLLGAGFVSLVVAAGRADPHGGATRAQRALCPRPPSERAESPARQLESQRLDRDGLLLRAAPQQLRRPSNAARTCSAARGLGPASTPSSNSRCRRHIRVPVARSLHETQTSLP